MFSTRVSLLDLIARHKLDANGASGLLGLAGLDRPPRGLLHWMKRGLGLLAAGLGGLGIIFWVAANWNTLGRMGQFALLQGVVLVMCAGAALRPAARTPLSMLALLAIGALFAALGQAYQTGADPWQLFALWALLGLPLALGTRSDAVWALWALVAMTALGLWNHAHAGFAWRGDVRNLGVQAATCGGALALALLLGRRCQAWFGAGPLASGLALTLACGQLAVVGCIGLFGYQHALPYFLALLVCAILAYSFSTRRGFDIYGLSISALALNFLVFAGLARLLIDSRVQLGGYLLLGMIAAGLLSLSVRVVLRLSRQFGSEGARA